MYFMLSTFSSLMISWLLPFRNIWEGAAAVNFHKTCTKSNQRDTLCPRSVTARRQLCPPQIACNSNTGPIIFLCLPQGYNKTRKLECRRWRVILIAPSLSRGTGFKTRLSSQQMVAYPTNWMGVAGAIRIDLKRKAKMFSNNIWSEKKIMVKERQMTR